MEKKESQEQIDRNRTAVALSYEPNMQAPKIVASGRGYLADKIIETAKESKIPLQQDEALANTLSKIQIGDQIPPELYEVVAEILVYVGDCDAMKRKVSEDT